MKLTDFYERCPVPIQNVAVSAYGLLLQWQRYGGASRRLAEGLREHEHWSADQLAALELDLLRSRALLALQQVPAYQGLRSAVPSVKAAKYPEEILDAFPILNKADVRGRHQEFVPTGVRGRLITGSTSGTTGTPLVLLRTYEGVRRNFAFFRRVRRWHGVTHWSRTATMMGRLVVPQGQAAAPFWRQSLATNNLLMSSYHFGPHTAAEYARAIAAFQPTQIVCYPSSGAAVAAAMLELGVRLQNTKVVFTTAETLSDAQRDLMQAAFGCPVADQYGASEWTVWISQCEHDTYHHHPDYGYLEVLDPDGRRVDKGHGRMIATGYVNDAMVLMRYDTGDNVHFGDNRQCDCGRRFRTISRVEGRADEVIRTPDGRLVGRLDPVFKGLTGIVECQLEQMDDALLVARVVVDETWNEQAERDFIEAIARRVGTSLSVRVERVGAIPRTTAGKFRAVIGLPDRTPKSPSN